MVLTYEADTELPEDAQISGTHVLQNLKLVVLGTTKPQISGTKVLQTLPVGDTENYGSWCMRQLRAGRCLLNLYDAN